MLKVKIERKLPLILGGSISFITIDDFSSVFLRRNTIQELKQGCKLAKMNMEDCYFVGNYETFKSREYKFFRVGKMRVIAFLLKNKENYYLN